MLNRRGDRKEPGLFIRQHGSVDQAGEYINLVTTRHLSFSIRKNGDDTYVPL